MENEMPLGLSFSLAMNEKAMEQFARMDKSQKEKVIENAKNVQSKEQMEGIVRDIEKGTAI